MADGAGNPSLLLQGLASAQQVQPGPRPVVGGVKEELLGQVLHGLGIKTTMEREALNESVRNSVYQMVNQGIDPSEKGIDLKKLAAQGILHPVATDALSGIISGPAFKQFKLQQQAEQLKNEGKLALAQDTFNLITGGGQQAGPGVGTVTAPNAQPQAGAPAPQTTALQRYEAASPEAKAALFGPEAGQLAQSRAALAESKRAAIEQQKTDRARTAAILEQSRAATMSGFYSVGNLTLDQAKEMSDFAHGTIKKLSPETLQAVKLTPAELASYRENVTAARTQIGTLQSQASDEIKKIDEMEREHKGTRLTQLGIKPAYGPEQAHADRTAVYRRLQEGQNQVLGKFNLGPDFTPKSLRVGTGTGQAIVPPGAPAAPGAPPAEGAAPEAMPAHGTKALDATTAQQFLAQHGGDKAKAREAAKAAGYTF